MNGRDANASAHESTKTPRAVLIVGFGNSGCAAVADLLRECDGIHTPDQEFYLLHHPDGLFALEDAILRSWNAFRPEWALRRFKRLVDVLARPPSKLRFGLDYDRLVCPDFTELASAYVDALVGLTYDGHFMFRRGEMGRAEYFAYLLARRFQLRPAEAYFFEKYSTACVVEPGEFMRHTRAFLAAVLRSMAARTGATEVGLLNGGCPYQVARCADYLPGSATIIVDRDPRDIYLSARLGSYMPHDVDRFVRWFRATRSHGWRAGPEKAMRILFEDLVTDYEENVSKIFRFLEIDPARHHRRGTKLRPQESARRIQKWKSYPRPDEIRLIERELEAYLWSGDAPSATGATVERSP